MGRSFVSGEEQEPEEPVDLAELRHVTIWARNPEGWNLEISAPDTMSPYEVYGMLLQATKNQKDELAAHNAVEDASES